MKAVEEINQENPMAPRETEVHHLDSPPLAFIRSPKYLNVLRAILKARKEFTPVVRDAEAHATQTRTYDYATLAAVKKSVRDHLLKHDLVEMSTHEPLAFNDGTVTLPVQVVLFYCGKDAEEPEYIGVRIEASAVDAQPKGIAAIQTYLRRYCDFGLHDIAPEDDENQIPEEPHGTGRPQDPRRSAPKAKPAAPKKAAPAASGAVPMAVVGHAAMKGKPITELSPEDLQWLMEFLEKGSADPENKWADKNKKDLHRIAEYINNNEEICAINSKITAMVVRALTPELFGE